jgi:hypothetical protein
VFALAALAALCTLCALRACLLPVDAAPYSVFKLSRALCGRGAADHPINSLSEGSNACTRLILARSATPLRAYLSHPGAPLPLSLQVWLKPSSEMSFLYGNHVLKSGLGRITDNTPAYAGVVVCSMADVPLGFATTAKSTLDCRKLDPSGIVAFHQADTGEYLRGEADMIGGRAD